MLGLSNRGSVNPAWPTVMAITDGKSALPKKQTPRRGSSSYCRTSVAVGLTNGMWKNAIESVHCVFISGLSCIALVVDQLDVWEGEVVWLTEESALHLMQCCSFCQMCGLVHCTQSSRCFVLWQRWGKMDTPHVPVVVIPSKEMNTFSGQITE